MHKSLRLNVRQVVCARKAILRTIQVLSPIRRELSIMRCCLRIFDGRDKEEEFLSGQDPRLDVE